MTRRSRKVGSRSHGSPRPTTSSSASRPGWRSARCSISRAGERRRRPFSTRRSPTLKVKGSTVLEDAAPALLAWLLRGTIVPCPKFLRHGRAAQPRRRARRALYVGALIGPGRPARARARGRRRPARRRSSPGPGCSSSRRRSRSPSRRSASATPSRAASRPTSAKGFGEAAAAVTGGWFLAAVVLGAPAVSLIGGYYVADLTGSGTAVAALVGLAMFGDVLSRTCSGCGSPPASSSRSRRC